MIIQKKIVASRAKRATALDILDTVGEYMKQEKFSTRHTRDILAILERKLSINPKVKLIDIYPDHHDYKLFFANSFSLNPNVASHAVKAGYKKGIDTPIIMISGHGTIDTAVECLQKGAYDFIQKPLDLNRTLISIRNAFERSDLVEETKVLKRKIHKGKTTDIIGESQAIVAIKEMIEKVAKNEFSCPYKELAKAKERVEKLTSYVRIIATTPPSPQMGWSNEVVDPRKYREEYINEAWDYLEQLRKEQE